MQTVVFKPGGVCAREITLTLSDDKKTLEDVQFVGGCDGNLKAISKLLAGQQVSYVLETLTGNTCGKRPTSCTDQLCTALREALKN